MATYQEQISKLSADAKERAIQRILEGIYAGKWFGREALALAYDAGARSSPTEAVQPVGFIESGTLPVAKTITREELDAALLDAARYRWLRDNLDLLSEWMENDIPTSQFDRTIDANVKLDAAMRRSAPDQP